MNKRIGKRHFFWVPALISLLAASCSINFAAIQAQMPELGNKADGTYRGEYELTKTPVQVTLDVHLQDTIITGIDIVKHQCSPIGKKAEKITQQIINAQSLEVDVITGATGSSKAILKAVEAALQ